MGRQDAALAAFEDRLRRKLRGLGAIEVVELAESRRRRPHERRAEEGARIEKAAGRGFVLLDPRGRMASSVDWARHIERAGGRITLVVGGPDGVPDAIRAGAQEVWSLGPLTLPHRLARLIAVEQLFRAATMLAGHPYHRAG